MIYQNRYETNLLQELAAPQNSECFSIISVVSFKVNIATEQKQAQLSGV